MLGLTCSASAQSADIPATTDNDSNIVTVSAAEFADVIKSDSAILLDVRTADEYKDGHIEGARNIDVLKDDFRSAAISQLPKDKTIAVYCRSGRRSMKAARTLAAEGYKVVNLRGGWLEWTGKK